VRAWHTEQLKSPLEEIDSVQRVEVKFTRNQSHIRAIVCQPAGQHGLHRIGGREVRLGLSSSRIHKELAAAGSVSTRRNRPVLSSDGERAPTQTRRGPHVE